MKKNIFYLPILLLLLLIFIPASVYGLYIHKLNKIHGDAIINDNGILVFRNENGEKIGTYTCKSDSCRRAPVTIDDQYLRHPSAGTYELGIISDFYTFIEDEAVIKLYNLKSNTIVDEYSSIKNYGYNTNYLIVCNKESKYGILNLKDMTYTIEPEYDFIGVNSKENLVNLESMVVKKDNSWFVIDKNRNVISPKTSNPIYDYSKKFLIVSQSTGNKILSISGDLVFEDKNITKADLFGDYIVYTNENGFYIADETVIIKQIVSSSSLYYSISNDKQKLDIYEDETIKESISIEDVSK